MWLLVSFLLFCVAAVLAAALHLHLELETAHAELETLKVAGVAAQAKEKESIAMFLAARDLAQNLRQEWQETTLSQAIKQQEASANQQLSKLHAELVKVGEAHHRTLTKHAQATKTIAKKDADIRRAQVLSHEKTKLAEAYVAEMSEKLASKGRTVAALTEKLHVVQESAAESAAFGCTPNTTISVIANVRLSTGDMDATGYTHRLCQTECAWNGGCKWLVVVVVVLWLWLCGGGFGFKRGGHSC